MADSYGLYVQGLPPESSLARAKEHAQQATALDDRNPVVHAFAAFTYLFSGEYQLTRRHAARAVSLNPNDPFALYVQACALSYIGDPEQALEWFAKSECLEPYAPDDQRLDILSGGRDKLERSEGYACDMLPHSPHELVWSEGRFDTPRQTPVER